MRLYTDHNGRIKYIELLNEEELYGSVYHIKKLQALWRMSMERRNYIESLADYKAVFWMQEPNPNGRPRAVQIKVMMIQTKKKITTKTTNIRNDNGNVTETVADVKNEVETLNGHRILAIYRGVETIKDTYFDMPKTQILHLRSNLRLVWENNHIKDIHYLPEFNLGEFQQWHQIAVYKP